MFYSSSRSKLAFEKRDLGQQLIQHKTLLSTQSVSKVCWNARSALCHEPGVCVCVCVPLLAMCGMACST
jgi:hypothetical protein